jgi:hypothetical protein
MSNVHRSAEHIERELAETRLNISQTLDVIQDRMSPGNLLMSVYHSTGFAAGRDRLGHASHQAVSQAGRAGAVIGESIRTNPMAATLVGVGVAWMLLGDAPARTNGAAKRVGAGSGVGHSRDLAERASRSGRAGMRALTDTVSGVAEGVVALARSVRDGARKVTGLAQTTTRVAAGAAGSAREHAAGVAHTAREQAAEAAHAARSQITQTSEVIMSYASTTRDRLGRTGRSALHYAEEHPLVTAGGFLAVGAIMAALLPRTRREQDIMGDAATDLSNEARAMAEGAYAEAKSAAKRVVHKASEAAEHEGLTPAQLKDEARTAAERVSNVAAAISKSARDEVDHAISKTGGHAAGEGGPERPQGGPDYAGRETRR